MGGLGIATGGGCNGDSDHVKQIQDLKDQVVEQRRRLAAKDELLRTQADHIQQLQQLGGERSLDRLVHVSGIELARLSGGYDADEDGVDDGVRVYLRLRDGDGDAIKATGSVRVTLTDLALPAASQQVGFIELGPEALRPLWYGRFASYHYTIEVPWSDGAGRPAHKSIVVRVQFTDLLTGQAFEIQEVVEVVGVAPGS